MHERGREGESEIERKVLHTHRESTHTHTRLAASQTSLPPVIKRAALRPQCVFARALLFVLVLSYFFHLFLSLSLLITPSPLSLSLYLEVNRGTSSPLSTRIWFWCVVYKVACVLATA